MLILTRKVGQRILISGDIRFEIQAIEGERVKIGISAPPEVSILREELVQTPRPMASEALLTSKEPKMAQPLRETITTTDHSGMLNAGGLLLIEQEKLDEEMDLDDLAAYNNTLLLSPGELLHLAAVIERHRPLLEAQERELSTSLRKVAEAWLNEFAPQAERLCAQGNHWWPQVRDAAHQTLIRLITEETHPVITAWYEQALRNKNVRERQQEILLTRCFKRLYYERYPVPKASERENERALDGRDHA